MTGDATPLALDLLADVPASVDAADVNDAGGTRSAIAVEVPDPEPAPPDSEPPVSPAVAAVPGWDRPTA